LIASSSGLGEVAALGLALGASPFGIIGVILLLNTEHPLKNSIAFMLGWMFAIVVVGIASVKLFPAPSTTSSSPATPVIVGQIVLGAALSTLGAIQWRRRTPKETAAEPKWMRRLRGVGPVLAFVIGAFLPTYALIFPATQAIEGSSLPRQQMILAFVVFLVLGTLGLLIPISIFAFRREQSEATLERWRLWLLGNQRAVGAVIMAALGLALLLRAVQGLAT
jgi:hypothetical protein